MSKINPNKCFGRKCHHYWLGMNWEGRALRGNKNFTLDNFRNIKFLLDFCFKSVLKPIKIYIYTCIYVYICVYAYACTHILKINIFAKLIIKVIVNYHFTKRSIASLGILTESDFFFLYVTHKYIKLLGKDVIFFWLFCILWRKRNNQTGFIFISVASFIFLWGEY